MNIPWDDVQVFLSLAQARSMSRAARALQVRQPTISRRIAALEQRLGYALFQRSANGVQLTAAGERLLVPATKMAEWAGEVARSAQNRGARASGLVRIAAPPGVAWDFVAPFAAWLRAKEPNITVQVLTGIHYVDLVRGEADLALRTRAPAQTDLVSVASLSHKNAVFVAKNYAQKLPKSPKLDQLDWICWAPPYEDLPPNPQLAAWIPNFRPAFTTDNFLIMRRAAERGLGAIVLGAVHHRFSDASSLVPLKLDLREHDKSSLHLVCAKSAPDIPRVRLVAERLADELERTREL
jgi:DNA-binding transcriptional LysR family regulator